MLKPALGLFLCLAQSAAAGTFDLATNAGESGPVYELVRIGGTESETFSIQDVPNAGLALFDAIYQRASQISGSTQAMRVTRGILGKLNNIGRVYEKKAVFVGERSVGVPLRLGRPGGNAFVSNLQAPPTMKAFELQAAMLAPIADAEEDYKAGNSDAVERVHRHYAAVFDRAVEEETALPAPPLIDRQMGTIAEEENDGRSCPGLAFSYRLRADGTVCWNARRILPHDPAEKRPGIAWRPPRGEIVADGVWTQLHSFLLNGATIIHVLNRSEEDQRQSWLLLLSDGSKKTVRIDDGEFTLD